MASPVTFTQIFRAYGPAEARRWTNPDGSEGGIVATSASVADGIHLPYTAIVGPNSVISNYTTFGGGVCIEHSSYIGSGARINPYASIGAFTYIGEWARIWNRSHILRNAVICSNADIGEEATVGQFSYIGDGARLGRRSYIDCLARVGAEAVIGADANVGYSTSVGAGAIIGDSVLIGNQVSIWDQAEYTLGDWLFVGGPQGNRDASATAVWSPKHGLRWWVGCQYGISTEYLRERVERDHGSSAHGDDYRYLIETVENHPGLKRAISAHEEAMRAQDRSPPPDA